MPSGLRQVTDWCELAVMIGSDEDRNKLMGISTMLNKISKLFEREVHNTDQLKYKYSPHVS